MKQICDVSLIEKTFFANRVANKTFEQNQIRRQRNAVSHARARVNCRSVQQEVSIVDNNQFVENKIEQDSCSSMDTDC